MPLCIDCSERCVPPEVMTATFELLGQQTRPFLEGTSLDPTQVGMDMLEEGMGYEVLVESVTADFDASRQCSGPDAVTGMCPNRVAIQALVFQALQDKPDNY